MTNELQNALRNGNLYDFIANNGWRFSKDELISIIKELDFAIYEKCGEEKLKEIETQTCNNMFDTNYEC